MKAKNVHDNSPALLFCGDGTNCTLVQLQLGDSDSLMQSSAAGGNHSLNWKRSQQEHVILHASQNVSGLLWAPHATMHDLCRQNFLLRRGVISAPRHDERDQWYSLGRGTVLPVLPSQRNGSSSERTCCMSNLHIMSERSRTVHGTPVVALQPVAAAAAHREDSIMAVLHFYSVLNTSRTMAVSCPRLTLVSAAPLFWWTRPRARD